METDGGTEATTGSSGNTAEQPFDAYLRASDDGVVVEANQAAETLLSVPDAELTNRQLSDLSQTVLSSTHEAVTAAATEQSFEAYDEQLERWIAGTAVPMAGDVIFMFREAHRRNQLDPDKQVLEQLHAVVTDSSRSPDEKIPQLLQIGADWFGTEYGFLTRIRDGTQQIVHSVGDNPNLQPGSTTPLSRAYCRRTIGREKPLAVADAPNEGWEDDPAYEQYGLDCYLGSTIYADNEQYGTVCFADPDPRDEPFTDQERAFAEVLTDWVHYQLEQQSYERELETQQAYMESLLDSLPDPLYALEPSGELTRWNSRLEEVMGYDAEELDGMDATSLVVDADREHLYDAIQSARNGNRISVEATVQTRGDVTVPYELSGGPLYDPQDEIVGVAGIGRDISQQKAAEEQLSGILSATRSLMQARDRQHVAEIAVNAARDVLGFDIGLFRLYNSDDKTLEPAAATPDAEAMLGERPVYDLDSGYPGEVFTTGEVRMIRDFETEEYDQPASLRSALYYPVGVHGTLSIGSTEPDAFDERDKQMLALLGTSAAAACMRAKREQEVREARKHTELVLDRVNGLIENTIEVLVQSTTRDEIEQGVVNQLAAAEPYTFAWVGRPDVASETISPTAWAGQSPLSVQGQTFELNRQGEPVSDAYHTETPQLVTELSSGGYGQWATILEDSTVDALVVLPLTYKDTTYGVLTVLAEDASAFDERERVVLEALGRAVANAINAVERGRILDATEIIELEFAIDDPKLLFSRLSASANCQLEAAGTNYRSDGSVRLYLTATGVDPEEFLDIVKNDGETSDVTCIVAHEDECLVELTVEESLLATLTEYGAVPQQVVASNGTARLTVELPYETEARELFDLVNKQYPGTDLLGYHERERPVETRQDFKAALSDRLTDRQETALRTAYLGGFFEWPREVDGNDLADAMDISRPTYHQHLRAAQGKVFEELFE